MSELIDRYLAALDAAEQVARLASERSANWRVDGWGYGAGAVEHDGPDQSSPIVYHEGHPTDAEAAHIALWDPALALRVLTAMRQRLDLHCISGFYSPGMFMPPVHNCRCGNPWPCYELLTDARALLGEDAT